MSFGMQQDPERGTLIDLQQAPVLHRTLSMDPPPDRPDQAQLPEEEFPMQLLAESRCVLWCLRFGTTCCFLSRNVLNILSVLLYTTASGLLIVPEKLTDDFSTLKWCNIAAVFMVAGAAASRELAIRAQDHVINNEREYARIMEYQRQQQQRQTAELEGQTPAATEV
jgi:hypothetical protein